MKYSLCRFASRAALLAVVFLSAPVAVAQPGSWTSQTSMRDVLTLEADGHVLWAGTTGGVFSYDTQTGEVRRFTPVEGTWGIDVRSIAPDPARGVVWVGYGDGVVDRIDIETGTVRSLFDIQRARQHTVRSVNNLRVHGDALYVSTAFGLVVFDAERLEVRDTYDQLGTIPAGTAVNDFTQAPGPGGAAYLWVATPQGVARAPVDTPNLREPGVWTIERDGLASTEINAIAFHEGQIFVGTGADVYRRADDGMYHRRYATDEPVRLLKELAGRLVAVDRFRIISVTGPNAPSRHRAEGMIMPTGVAMTDDGRFWFSDRNEGIAEAILPDPDAASIDVVRTFYPEGPYHGQFSQIDSGPDGTIWAVAGAVAFGTGIYRRTPDGIWTDFLPGSTSGMEGLSGFQRVLVDAAGRALVGTHGSGLVVVDADGSVQTFNHTNSTLRPIPGSTSYVVAGGAATDRDGTLWVTNTVAPNPLHVRLPDGTWAARGPYVGSGLAATMNAYNEILIDSFGQKWVIVLDERNLSRRRGLLVLEATTGGAEVEAFRFFGTEGGLGQGLPGIEVFAMAEDRDGRMWLGTDKGLAYIINNGIVARDPNLVPIWPQQPDRSLLLYGLKINAIAVDAANRLWVGGDDGVRLIEDTGSGFEIVKHFTRSNSPLFTSTVRSIAVDDRTGHVYFATDLGLVSYEGEAIRPAAGAGNLRVYPNPVRASGDEAVTVYIEGLMEAADIRIVTASGNLVAALESRGGRVSWDGRDRFGNPVASGVYLVIAVGRSGEGTSYGRVAVIR
jgi:hypothetical protein